VHKAGFTFLFESKFKVFTKDTPEKKFASLESSFSKLLKVFVELRGFPIWSKIGIILFFALKNDENIHQCSYARKH